MSDSTGEQPLIVITPAVDEVTVSFARGLTMGFLIVAIVFVIFTLVHYSERGMCKWTNEKTLLWSVVLRILNSCLLGVPGMLYNVTHRTRLVAES